MQSPWGESDDFTHRRRILEEEEEQLQQQLQRQRQEDNNHHHHHNPDGSSMSSSRREGAAVSMLNNKRGTLGQFIERSTSAPPSSSEFSSVHNKYNQLQPHHALSRNNHHHDGSDDVLVGTDLLEHMTRGVYGDESGSTVMNSSQSTTPLTTNPNQRSFAEDTLGAVLLGHIDNSGRATAPGSSFSSSSFQSSNQQQNQRFSSVGGAITRPMSASGGGGGGIHLSSFEDLDSFDGGGGDGGHRIVTSQIGMVRSQSAAPTYPGSAGGGRSLLPPPPGLTKISSTTAATTENNVYNTTVAFHPARRAASTGVIGTTNGSASGGGTALKPAAKTLMDLIQEDFPDELLLMQQQIQQQQQQQIQQQQQVVMENRSVDGGGRLGIRQLQLQQQQQQYSQPNEYSSTSVSYMPSFQQQQVQQQQLPLAENHRFISQQQQQQLPLSENHRFISQQQQPLPLAENHRFISPQQQQQLPPLDHTGQQYHLQQQQQLPPQQQELIEDPMQPGQYIRLDSYQGGNSNSNGVNSKTPTYEKARQLQQLQQQQVIGAGGQYQQQQQIFVDSSTMSYDKLRQQQQQHGQLQQQQHGQLVEDPYEKLRLHQQQQQQPILIDDPYDKARQQQQQQQQQMLQQQQQRTGGMVGGAPQQLSSLQQARQQLGGMGPAGGGVGNNNGVLARQQQPQQVMTRYVITDPSMRGATTNLSDDLMNKPAAMYAPNMQSSLQQQQQQQQSLGIPSQQVYYTGQQQAPQQQQQQQVELPPTARIQTMPMGQSVYVNTPPAPMPQQAQYGYTTVQYHASPHPGPPQHQIIHHHNPAHPNVEGAGGQYVSVVSLQGGGPQLTYWQPDGMNPSGNAMAPVAIVSNPGANGTPVAVARMGGIGGLDAHATPYGGRNQHIREKSSGSGSSGGGRGRRGGTNNTRRSGGGGSGGGGGGGSDSKHSSHVVSSPLLEDFRSTKNRNWTMYQIEGHVVEFCQDQNGSRFIQQRLEMGDIAEQQIVTREVLPAIRRLRNDVFGNYVVQKLLDFGTPQTKIEIRDTLEGEMLQLSLQMYGCRVVQKALEALDEDDLPRLLTEFQHNVLSCIHDQNGNHVIQKCIEVMSTRAKKARAAGDESRAFFLTDQIDFIVTDVLVNTATLSCHPYGCRVLQRILEHCEDEKKTAVLNDISKSHRRLLDDQYGNYVIQHVLQFGRQADRDSILQIIVESGLLGLSRQKFASNVVEKLLKYGNGPQRRAIVREMLKKVDDSSMMNKLTSASGGGTSVVLLMVRDAYANYVVQTTLDVVPESDEKRLLLEELNAHSEELRNYTFAKHIVTKLQSLNSGGS